MITAQEALNITGRNASWIEMSEKETLDLIEKEIKRTANKGKQFLIYKRKLLLADPDQYCADIKKILKDSGFSVTEFWSYFWKGYHTKEKFTYEVGWQIRW